MIDPFDTTKEWTGVSHFEKYGHLEKEIYVLVKEPNLDVFTTACQLCNENNLIYRPSKIPILGKIKELE